MMKMLFLFTNPKFKYQQAGVPLLIVLVVSRLNRSSDAFQLIPSRLLDTPFWDYRQFVAVARVTDTVSGGTSVDTTRLYAIGGGSDDNRPPPNGRSGSDNSWDDFFGPINESENLQRARELISENTLPISFDSRSRNEEEPSSDGDSKQTELSSSSSSSSSLTNTPDMIVGGLTKEQLRNNPYIAVVTRISPSELISKFTTTAHPRVHTAVRSTVLSLIGGLPKKAFETTTVTTGQKLASLMFQLQMTGYMFKNADYKLSMEQALGFNGNNGQLLPASILDEDNDPLKGKIKGKLRVKYRRISAPSTLLEGDEEEASSNRALAASSTMTPSSAVVSNDDEDNNIMGEIEVDAAAYMSELRSEVSSLREALVTRQKEQEDALRKDLLLYIRTLPEKELRSLTSTMSPDVLVAMKGLVNAILTGIGEGQIGPETVTEQSGEAMAQLCMWQLAIGYNLRTLEVREEMRKNLSDNALDGNMQHGGGVNYGPGVLE